MLARTSPRLLRRAWALSDPASRCDDRCDALDQVTPHQRLRTAHGPYWICSATGPMHYNDPPDDLVEQTDQHYPRKLADRTVSAREAVPYRRWLQRLTPHRQTGRLSEVGCGNGLFLQVAVQPGLKYRQSKRPWRRCDQQGHAVAILCRWGGRHASAFG